MERKFIHRNSRGRMCPMVQSMISAFPLPCVQNNTDTAASYFDTARCAYNLIVHGEILLKAG